MWLVRCGPSVRLGSWDAPRQATLRRCVPALQLEESTNGFRQDRPTRMPSCPRRHMRHHRPERSWHGREANRPRVGHTQSPGPVAGNLGGGSVHVHDRTSCNAAVLAHVHTRSGPRKPGLRVMPEARACCVGDLAPSPARPTARPRRGNTSFLLRLDSDSDGHTKPRPEPKPSWDTRVGPA